MDIRTLYNKGFTDGEISIKLGVCRTKIMRWRRKNRLPPNIHVCLYCKTDHCNKGHHVCSRCRTALRPLMMIPIDRRLNNKECEAWKRKIRYISEGDEILLTELLSWFCELKKTNRKLYKH